VDEEVSKMQAGPDRREPDGEVWRVERVVVLQILRADHDECWPSTELAGELSDLAPAVLEEALTHLERDGVLQREGDSVRATRAVRRLDELELIGI
jgi:DNA-binding HxlR family transcriptional regulator